MRVRVGVENAELVLMSINEGAHFRDGLYMVVLWVDFHEGFSSIPDQVGRMSGCTSCLLSFVHSGVICPAWGLSSKGGNRRDPIRMAFLQQENC